MANPLQALGNILQGKQPDATACKDIFEGVQKDDAHAVEHFLSRGVRINDLNGVRAWVPTSSISIRVEQNTPLMFTMRALQLRCSV